MKLKFYFLSFCILSIMNLNAQDLKKHQWKNRVILIITNNSKSKIYTSQIEEFKTSAKEFKARKLLTYYVLPNTYKLENNTEDWWRDSSEFYKNYNPKNLNFKLILIGLDGSIKLEQNDVVTTKELFSTIDAMPMRRAEIKNKR